MSSNLDLLKQLREITGAGILDCKKYLLQAENNLDEAVKLMRSEEGIKAEKKSSRVAAEGVVFFNSNEKKSILLEINSETDFVARSDDFMTYVEQVSQSLLSSDCADMNSLTESSNTDLVDSLEKLRKEYITKLGENIKVRRFIIYSHSEGFVAGYTHNHKIGSLVKLKSKDTELSKDITMQIVASNPLALDEKSIDSSLLESEKEIYKKELDKINKKDDIKRNILEGKVKKFITDNTLLNQPFIKDGSKSLKKILSDNEIISYVRYQLGEGIDKKQEDFAEEVYSQIK